MTRKEICDKARRIRIQRLRKTFWKRFWKRVNISGPTSCWLWNGTKRSNGYGTVRKAGVIRTVHRLVYESKVSKIPKGFQVCHHCDVKNCVNPDHLFAGTAWDNVQDCIQKGRRRKVFGPIEKLQGEKHHKAKLTNRLVRKIRRMDLSADGAKANLARKLGVSGPLISYILSRKIWKHI